MHTLRTHTHTHPPAGRQASGPCPCPSSAGPAWREPFGSRSYEHVAPGDEHDARLETLCVGESR
jgi:hypothetical protein